MSTARIFQIIDLRRLSPELATQLKLAHARQKENASTALPKMVRLLMEAEPGTCGAAIDQARHWFTRNIETIERIEQETQSLPSFGSLTPVRAEILEGCRQGRLFALQMLKRLNTQYERAVPRVEHASATAELAPGPDFEAVHREILAFYAEMETVENQIVASGLKLVALRNRSQFEAQNLELEEKMDAQNQLQHRLEMLRSEIASQPKVGNDPNTRSWIHLENEANQREVIALEQKAAQMEKELEEARQTIERMQKEQKETEGVRQAIERLRGSLPGTSVKDIQELTLLSPPRLSQQGINKRIQKLQKNGWLPPKDPKENNTTYYFTPEQVKLILAPPGGKKPAKISKNTLFGS